MMGWEWRRWFTREVNAYRVSRAESWPISDGSEVNWLLPRLLDGRRRIVSITMNERIHKGGNHVQTLKYQKLTNLRWEWGQLVATKVTWWKKEDCEYNDGLGMNERIHEGGNHVQTLKCRKLTNLRWEWGQLVAINVTWWKNEYCEYNDRSEMKERIHKGGNHVQMLKYRKLTNLRWEWGQLVVIKVTWWKKEHCEYNDEVGMN